MPDAGAPDDARDRSLDLRARLSYRVRRHRPREPRAAPSTPGPPAVRAPTTSVTAGTESSGSGCPRLGGLAVQSRHRAARHGSGVAPPRLPALLAVEVQAEPGRSPEARRRASHLIRRMARENPTWGRRRIQAELALLGYEVAELTVAKYMHRTSPRPSPTWRVFLAAHAREHRRRRLLRRADPDLPPPVRLRRAPPRPPRTPPRQRHRPPHGSLDRPADRRGVPGRFGSAGSCFGIETRSTARSSRGESSAWGFARS